MLSRVEHEISFITSGFDLCLYSYFTWYIQTVSHDVTYICDLRCITYIYVFINAFTFFETNKIKEVS